MSRKSLGIVAALAVVVAAVVLGTVLLRSKTPSEAEIRSSIASALSDGARIETLAFEAFPTDRSSGRVSVKGTFSFGADVFTEPGPPVELLNALSASGVFDDEVIRWWREHANLYPQFNGKLLEFKRIYEAGSSLPFSGELPYFGVVDGMKVDASLLERDEIVGTAKPNIGYLVEPTLVAELSAQVITWRDRKRAEAAAAEAARVAEAEAAAREAARLAAIEAEAAAKAAVAEAAARAEAEAAAERAKAESVRDAEVGPCLRINTDKIDCVTVVFGFNTKYDRTARYDDATTSSPAKSYCITHDGGNAVQTTHLGGDRYRFMATDGVVVQFFDLPVGQSFRGFTCGN